MNVGSTLDFHSVGDSASFSVVENFLHDLFVCDMRGPDKLGLCAGYEEDYSPDSETPTPGPSEQQQQCHLMVNRDLPSQEAWSRLHQVCYERLKHTFEWYSGLRK